MVTRDPMRASGRAAGGALRRWAGALQRDLSRFAAVLHTRADISPGLYTYRIALPGGRRRLHLRIEPAGGLLFVDAMDVIHLNPTAAVLTKLALDGVPPQAAVAVTQRHFRGAARAQVEAEFTQIRGMVDHLTTSTSGCPTCALSEVEQRALFSTRATAPYKADLALTYGCNNACAHCYNEPARLAMPSLTVDGWFRVLDRLHAVGVPHVIFTGGEATLHPDLPAIIAHADRLGQITGLNTNGRRIAHRPYVHTLAASGLNHLQVTLASHRAEIHNTINGAEAFQQTIRGIENALGAGVHTITNTTLMQSNKEEIEPLLEFLHGLGICTFAMNGMIYSGGGFRDPRAIPEAELAPLLLLARDKAEDLGMRFLWYTPTEYCRMSPVELEIGAKRCNAAEYSICIEPNGDVLPCQSFYASAGNVLRDPWETIWQGDLFRSFRHREDDPRLAGLPEMCWECPDLPLCGGGCRIEREARDGRKTVSGGCNSCTTAAEPAGFVPMGMLVDTALRCSGADPVARTIHTDDETAAEPCRSLHD